MGLASVTIHRGTHQIGGVVTEIRSGEHRIVIDFGENLPGSWSGNTKSDEALVQTVFGSRPDAVLFTHYHGDHYGMYKRIPSGIPLYIGATAKEILEILTERLDHVPGNAIEGLPIIRSMKTYPIERRMRPFGDICVTPLVVDHSALDAYMFLIETGGKRILYTGDFRDHGVAGSEGRFEKMLGAHVGKVDVLITEGTMLSRIKEEQTNPIRTETDLGRCAGEIFRQNKQNVVLISSTNIDSIMEIFHAVPPGMDLVCDEYQAEIILAAIKRRSKYYATYKRPTVHGKPRRIYIVGDMRHLGREQDCYAADFGILKKKGFVLLARENNNPKVKKNRFEKIVDKLDDPLIIYSKWQGYLDRAHGGYSDEHADPAVNRFLGSHRMETLHVSGHAYVETIQKLIEKTEPKCIIPMHTECADEMKQMPEFAACRECIHVLQDGETCDLEGLGV